MKGPTHSYIDLMDAAIQAKAAEENAARSFFPLRPSSAGKCTRKLAHELAAYHGLTEKVEEKRNPNVTRLLKLGHHIEEQVGDELKLIPGYSVRFQQQVVDMFKLEISGKTVEGSTDFVLWNDETRGVLDAKSIGDRYHSQFGTKWRGLQKDYQRMGTAIEFAENAFWVDDLPAFLSELGPEDSLYDNLYQLNAYACSDFLQRRRVDHGSIIRYLKNSSHLQEVRFKPSMELFEEMGRRFNLVEKALHIDTNIDYSGKSVLERIQSVPKERVLGGISCAYCPYQRSCWPSSSKKDAFGNMPQKQWAVRTSELQEGAQIEALLEQRLSMEKAAADLTKLDAQLILLIEGHQVEKIKALNGDVFEVKHLAKHAELRRGKE